MQNAFVRWWRRFPNGDRDHVPRLFAAVRTIALDLRRGTVRRDRAAQSRLHVWVLSVVALKGEPQTEHRRTAELALAVA